MLGFLQHPSFNQTYLSLSMIKDSEYSRLIKTDSKWKKNLILSTSSQHISVAKHCQTILFLPAGYPDKSITAGYPESVFIKGCKCISCNNYYTLINIWLPWPKECTLFCMRWGRRGSGCRSGSWWCPRPARRSDLCKQERALSTSHWRVWRAMLFIEHLRRYNYTYILYIG